jgi:PKD domain
MTLYIFIGSTLSSQTPYSIPKHNYQWLLTKPYEDLYGGQACALMLNHNTTPPTIDYLPNFNYPEYDWSGIKNTITMSDANGNLAFYFWNHLLYNKDSEIIAGSNDIQDSIDGDWYNQYFNDIGNVVSIPKPGSNNLFYMFFARPSQTATNAIIENEYWTMGFDKVYYLLLDVNANNGEGSIIEKKVSLVEDTLMANNPMAICRHANGRDWWLLLFEGKTYLSYYRFLITPPGIIDMGKYTDTQSLFSVSSGRMRFSEKGDKLFTKKTLTSFFFMHDFDRCTGILSNPNTFDISYTNSTTLYPLESDWHFSLSGNSKVLYSGGGLDSLFQFDLGVPNISGSQYLVLEAAGQDAPPDFDPYDDNYTGMGHSGLAPDSKIYVMANSQNRPFLRVINHPNLLGPSCQAILTDFDLGCNIGGLANSWNDFVNYRAGPVDGTVCDSLGIDNIPIAHFDWHPEENDSLNGQFDNLSMFNPISYLWDFGDGSTSTLEAPTHSYAVKGTYYVCLTASNDLGSDTYCKNLFINVPVSTNDNPLQPIKLGPNPTLGKLQVQLPTNYGGIPYLQIVLHNMEGKIVFAEYVSNYFIHNFDVSQLPGGNYICYIEANGHVFYQEQLVKY